jgi:hypothetical protein
MASEASRGEDHGRWHRWLRLIPFAFVAGLLAGVWQQTPVRPEVCGSDLPRWAHVVYRVCPYPERFISSREATDFVDRFLAKSRGSQRAEDLQENYVRPRDALSKKGFAGDWDPVIYAERVEPLERTETPNEFTVLIRRYRVPTMRLPNPDFYTSTLGVDKITMTIHLTRESSAGQLWATDVRLAGRDPVGTWKQRRDVAVALTDFYDLPVRRPDSQQNLGRGATVYEICQLAVPQGVERQWWASTYLGWVPHADLAAGEGNAASVPVCEPTVLRRLPETR